MSSVLLRRRFWSLRARLIVTFVGVLALILAVLGTLVSLLADWESSRFRESLAQGRAQHIADLVSKQFQDGGWPAVDATLSTIGSALGWQVLVENNDGAVVAYYGPALAIPVVFDDDSSALRVPIVDSSDREVGHIAAMPYAYQVTPLDRMPGELADAFTDWLLWVGLIAGAGGAVLIALLTIPVLGPLKALARANRGLSRGDFSQRVAIHARDEIGELGETFNHMAAELQHVEAQRKQLFADIAHELRTPLTNAKGYLDAIRDGLREPDERTLSAIYRQFARLTRLVENLRLLAMAEMGQLALDRRPTRVAPVLESAVQEFEARAQFRGIHLTADIPSDLPSATIDAHAIAQVLANLIDNALQHTPSSGAVAVKAHADERWIEVNVTDTGEGIGPEAMHSLFERRYRAESQLGRGTGGMGIGLAIAKQLVESHDGDIRVDSTVGRGSMFTFRIPSTSMDRRRSDRPKRARWGAWHATR